MPNPHPGQWQLVLNQSGCELNTQNTAVHALILTPFCRQGEKPVSSLKGELAWKRRNAERNTNGSSRSMP